MNDHITYEADDLESALIAHDIPIQVDGGLGSNGGTRQTALAEIGVEGDKVPKLPPMPIIGFLVPGQLVQNRPIGRFQNHLFFVFAHQYDNRQPRVTDEQCMGAFEFWGKNQMNSTQIRA